MIRTGAHPEPSAASRGRERRGRGAGDPGLGKRTGTYIRLATLLVISLMVLFLSSGVCFR
jgi:hypothetical protein